MLDEINEKEANEKGNKKSRFDVMTVAGHFNEWVDVIYTCDYISK